MEIRPSNEYCLWKIDVDLSKEKQPFELYVEKGCQVCAVLSNTREKHYLFSGRRYNNLLQEFKVEKNFLGRLLPNQILHIYVANEKISEYWGISGIPYLEENGESTFVGCNGEIIFQIKGADSAYQRVSSWGNITLEEGKILSRDVWKAIHAKMDPIIRNILSKYYRESDRRDGTDFEKYENEIKLRFNEEFSREGIAIEEFNVANLSDPQREKKVEEEIAVSSLPIESIKETPAREMKCQTCGLVNKAGVHYCIRCGRELN